MLKSYQSKGLQYHPDMFSSGETSNGCGHALRTTWQGTPATAADYITKEYAKPNTTIKCDVTVDKVILEEARTAPLKLKVVSTRTIVAINLRLSPVKKSL